MSAATETQPWYTAFPAPTVTAPIMPRRRAAQMLSLKGVAAILVIDVRRTDFEGGMITSGLNIPAQGKSITRAEAIGSV